MDKVTSHSTLPKGGGLRRSQSHVNDDKNYNNMTTISETRISVRLQPETSKAVDKVPVGTMAEQSMNLGLVAAEPLLLAMDGLLRYAKAYTRRFGGQLAEDYVLGPEWLAAAKGIRGLLNGDGAVALERGITTDSKDNGVIEEMFWAALGIAGFKEADL